MRAFPHRPTTQVRAGALFISLALFGAACGGTDESATTEPTATEPSTSVVVTTQPATTLPAPPEPAPTTTTPSVGFPGDGEWTAYYRVTADNLWWGTTDIAVSYPVTFECDDAACSTGTSTPNPAGEPVAAPFTFDGDILSTQFDQMEACLDPTTGEPNGPKLTATTLIDTMAPVLDGTDIVAFVGVRNFAAVTVGSAECTEEEGSYTADVLYLRDDVGTPAAITADGWFRAGFEEVVERAIRLCTATPCDLQYRIPRQQLVADGSYQPVFLDVLLTQNADGTYTGSTSWVDSCASDVDNSFVATEGYDTTLEVTLTAVQVGEQVIIRATEAQSGTPHASLTPEQAAVCTSYEFEESVNGIRMMDGAVDVISWVDPPINQ